MSKMKSEKEAKDKKSTGKKAGVKAKKPSAPAVPVPAVAAPLAKKPVKPKKPRAVAKKAGPAKASAITNEAIGLRAYFIAERRHKMGWPGDSTSDWVEAERQLAVEAKRDRPVGS